MGATSNTSFIYSAKSDYICCFFAQKSVLCGGNVGYSRAVYPVLCELSFIPLWSYIYMFSFNSAFEDRNKRIFADIFPYWVNMAFAEQINSYKVDGKNIAYSLTTSLDAAGENPRFSILVYSPKTSSFLTIVFIFVYEGRNYLYKRKWAKPSIEENSFKSTAEFLLREFSNANLQEVIAAYYFGEYRTLTYYLHEITFK